MISQIYGGGNNSGATYQNDFIEIFNSGNTTVNLSGWSVQYNPAGTTTTWSTTALSGSIAPGQYYLVKEAGGTTNGAVLPTADATGTINLNAATGKVALVNSTTALTGGCPGDDGSQPFNPNNASIVDLVGYGSSVSTAGFCYEGSPAPAPTGNTQSALRAAGGCTDNNVNSSDFSTATASARNTATPTNQCPGTIAPEATLDFDRRWTEVKIAFQALAIVSSASGGSSRPATSYSLLARPNIPHLLFARVQRGHDLVGRT